MTTTTDVLAADWATLSPGATVVAIDGYPTDPLTVEAIEGGVLRFASDRSVTALRLYPGSHLSVTIAAAPQPVRVEPWSLDKRTLAALRRNPRYVRLLRHLAGLTEPYAAQDRGEGVCLAAMAEQNGYRLTERVGRRWQITDTGRRYLAHLDR